MAATELTHERPGRAAPHVRGIAWAYSYAGVWALTGAGALAVQLGGEPTVAAVRAILKLKLASGRADPDPAWNIAMLSAHNLPIVSWPLLLGLAGADRTRLGRAAADVLVLASAGANTLPVGAALGAYGSALIAYVPQLPVEWTALALGLAAWAIQRDRPLSGRERTLWLAVSTTSVVVAAVLETMAVPSG